MSNLVVKLNLIILTNQKFDLLEFEHFFFFFEALVLDLTSIWILIFKFVEIDLGSS